MEKKLKLHELDEKQQKERIAELKKKAKKITKRVLLAVGCSLIILLLVFSLIAGIFDKKDDTSGSLSNTNETVELY